MNGSDAGPNQYGEQDPESKHKQTPPPTNAAPPPPPDMRPAGPSPTVTQDKQDHAKAVSDLAAIKTKVGNFDTGAYDTADQILDPGASGMHFFDRFLPAYNEWNGTSISLQDDIEVLYDRERGISFANMRHDAGLLTDASNAAGNSVTYLQSAQKTLLDTWQGPAADSFKSDTDTFFGNGNTAAQNLGKASGWVSNAIGYLQSIIYNKADAVASLYEPVLKGDTDEAAMYGVNGLDAHDILIPVARDPGAHGDMCDRVLDLFAIDAGSLGDDARQALAQVHAKGWLNLVMTPKFDSNFTLFKNTCTSTTTQVQDLLGGLADDLKGVANPFPASTPPAGGSASSPPPAGTGSTPPASAPPTSGATPPTAQPTPQPAPAPAAAGSGANGGHAQQVGATAASMPVGTTGGDIAGAGSSGSDSTGPGSSDDPSGGDSSGADSSGGDSAAADSTAPSMTMPAAQHVPDASSMQPDTSGSAADALGDPAGGSSGAQSAAPFGAAASGLATGAAAAASGFGSGAGSTDSLGGTAGSGLAGDESGGATGDDSDPEGALGVGNGSVAGQEGTAFGAGAAAQQPGDPVNLTPSAAMVQAAKQIHTNHDGSVSIGADHDVTIGNDKHGHDFTLSEAGADGNPQDYHVRYDAAGHPHVTAAQPDGMASASQPALATDHAAATAAHHAHGGAAAAGFSGGGSAGGGAGGGAGGADLTGTTGAHHAGAAPSAGDATADQLGAGNQFGSVGTTSPDASAGVGGGADPTSAAAALGGQGGSTSAGAGGMPMGGMPMGGMGRGMSGGGGSGEELKHRYQQPPQAVTDDDELEEWDRLGPVIG